MDIKLNARLSAYSKIDSISSGACCHEYVTKDQIDGLFEDMEEPTSVTKSEIDKLFEEVEEPKSVSKTEIDTLFAETQEPESVTKDQIDGLFAAPAQPVKSVSYSEIDSLFK